MAKENNGITNDSTDKSRQGFLDQRGKVVYIERLGFFKVDTVNMVPGITDVDAVPKEKSCTLLLRGHRINHGQPQHDWRSEEEVAIEPFYGQIEPAKPTGVNTLDFDGLKQLVANRKAKWPHRDPALQPILDELTNKKIAENATRVRVIKA